MGNWNSGLGRRSMTGIVAIAAVLATSSANAAVARSAVFDIPAQPLANALPAFSVQSGTSVVFDPITVATLRSQAVSGRIEAERALERLLEGTGLSAIRLRGGYVVKRGEGKAPPVAQMTALQDAGREETAKTPSDEVDVASSDNAIIVTARRMEERLQDVPISITVFNQQQLASRNIVDATDLATFTPSLSSNSRFGSQNASFAIRGFVQEIGTAPSVGVYFADVVAPRGASNGVTAGDGSGPGDFFDLQNVQVLKGPQGTLFGRNTTGGAILLVPKKPTSGFDGFVQGQLGNFDMWRLQGVVNVPIGETFRLRIGADHQERRGFLNNMSDIGPKHFNGVDYTALRVSAVADLTPDLENYTIVTYAHSKTEGTVQKVIAANPAVGFGALAAAQLVRQGDGFYNVMNNLAEPVSMLEQWRIINTTTWMASDALTIKNIVSYAQLKNDLASDLFGTDFIVGSHRVAFSKPGPIPGGHTASQSTFTEELQFQGQTGDDRLVWQAGAYMELSRPIGDAGSLGRFLASCGLEDEYVCSDPIGAGAYNRAIAGGADPATFRPIHVAAINYTRGRTSFTNYGIYGQATWSFTPELKLTGGLRYTWDRQTNVSERKTYVLAYPPSTGLFPVDPVNLPVNPRCTDPSEVPDCIQNTRQSSSAPTWLISLDYSPADDLLLYAKYSRGYRAGSISPNITSDFRIVRPEKVDTYEIGFKSSFSGPVRGTFNAAAFYNDFSNQQIQVGFNSRPGSGQASTAAPVNAGRSELYGVEVEASLNPFDGFTLDGGYTFLKTRIKSVPDFSGYTDPNFTLDAGFRVGDPLVMAPRNKFTLSANYQLPLDESIGTVTIGAIYTHSDKSLANYSSRASSSPVIASYAYLPATNLLNLNVGWSDIGGLPVDLSVFATNVTNKHYWVYDGGNGYGSGFEAVALAAPRVWGMGLKYRFGN